MKGEERPVIHSSPPVSPPERKKFLRLIQVRETIGLSRATIYRKIAAHEFPRPVRLGSRAVGWVEADVIGWMNEREQLSRNGKQTS
jgi:prophage regulatory protein